MWSLFPPRSRSRTRYLAVPRTRAMTSPAVAELSATRPLAKYDWPRERTASLNTRETFWAIPIIPSQLGRANPIQREGRLGSPLQLHSGATFAVAAEARPPDSVAR